MDSLFSFIPQNIDKNMRLVIIFLMSLQFTAFVLYMYFTIKDFLKIRRERINNEISDKLEFKYDQKVENADKNEKIE